MRIKEEFMNNPTKLMEMGFRYEKVINDYDEECYETEGRLTYNMGHSRRGQFYYLIIEGDGKISIFATKPDGDGTSLMLDDILYKLFAENIITA